MTNTPWGPSEKLRTRKLRPGPSGSRAAVAQNQRERLMGATVAAVSERGYEAARVADVLEIAGVSRSAFYRHFANKHECFVATVEELLERAGQMVANAYGSCEGSWDDRLQAALDALLRMIVDQPAAARLCVSEVYAAGPEAIERVERIADDFVGIAADALRESPERAGIPRNLIRAILGGLRQIIHTRLRHHREAELISLAPDLLAWGLGYRTPPQPLRRPRKPPSLPPSTPDPNEQRARILAAVTELVAERGYQALTITEIAQRAAVSLTTFYAHFAGKPDVFLAAIEDGERQVREAVVPAYRAAPHWPRAVKDGLHAFFACLTVNPAGARLGGLDIYSGGPDALERQESVSRRFQTLFSPDPKDYPGPPPITAEAISGSILALLYEQLRLKGASRLYEVAPTATFMALAPALGADRASALANAGWRPAA